MKRQLQGILYYLSTEVRYPLSVFWMILGGFLVLSILLYVFLGGGHTIIIFHVK